MDAALREEIGALLGELATRHELAIVMACHDVKLVDQIADSVAEFEHHGAARIPTRAPAAPATAAPATARTGGACVLSVRGLSAWIGKPGGPAIIRDVAQVVGPRAFVNSAKAAGVRATYEVRIRGGDSFHFVFDNGDLRVEEPSSRKVDCYISAEPVAFLMLFWARQGQWPAIAKGTLLAWGRKPWLGPQLRGLIRNP